MKKLLGALLFFLASLTIVNAQNFEGTVEMEQISATGTTYKITWFIKKDKIAYEIKTGADNGSLKMRFVPQPKQNTMLMIVNSQEGNSKREISTRDISSDIDMSKAEVKENGTKTHADFGELTILLINTPEANTEVEVVKSIDVDLSKYASYLKNEYGIHALIQTKQIGFPLNSITKDKNGKLISQTKVISIKPGPVSEEYFH